jgi:Actinobacteria/chloroflexi VLRF1 release factor
MPSAGPHLAGDGRRVIVAAERLPGFLDRFAARHGELVWDATPLLVTVTATDGAVAVCRVPFPPLTVDPAAPYGGLLGHVLTDRRVGVLLVRRGGYAAGIFEGTRLVESKVGSRHVQGRSAAGGWSQQRFARRREGQARVAFSAAADTVAATILPVVATLAAVVAGGDRSSCDHVLADPRLASLRALLVEERLDVPDPRRRVLEATPAAFRGVRVQVVDTEESLGH